MAWPKWWPWAVGGGALALLALGGGVVVYKARGLRNHNPGNLKKNGTSWQGLAATQSDPTFFVFTAPFYGLRAMARVLLNYQAQHGLTTVKDIVNRWAPPIENNTGEYVNHVAQVLGVSPTENIRLTDAGVLTKLVKAIVKHENGLNPYSDALVADAARQAQVA